MVRTRKHEAIGSTDLDVADCDPLPYTLMSRMISPSLGWHSSLVEGDVTSVHKIHKHGRPKPARKTDEEVARGLEGCLPRSVRLRVYIRFERSTELVDSQRDEAVPANPDVSITV